MYKGTKKRGKETFRDRKRYSKKKLPHNELCWHDSLATITKQNTPCLLIP